MSIKTDLDYYSGAEHLPEDAIRISASQFYKFMDKPHIFYREKFLGEIFFEGNTASVIGTICHYCVEKYAKNEEIQKDQIEAYITKHLGNLEVDCAEVQSQYPLMVETLINNYVAHNKPDQVEPFVKYELLPGIWPSGSIDGIQGSIPEYSCDDEALVYLNTIKAMQN